jgi:hypothetical protein
VATSIISGVPAMADEVKTIDAQDGTVQSAKAYGNGVFLVYGYKTQDDDDYTYVDMKNNFQIVNDNLNKTQIDDVARKIKYKIKHDNDGRFNEDYYKNTTPTALPKRPGVAFPFLDGFSGKWAHYNYKLNDLLIKDKLNGRTESYSTIYSDIDGNYVDADYSFNNKY